MLIVNLIWIVIGIVYVVYKLIKEEQCIKDGLKEGLIVAGAIVVSGSILQGLGYVIGYAIEGEHGARLGSDIGGIIFCSAILIFIIVYNIYLHFFWKP